MFEERDVCRTVDGEACDFEFALGVGGSFFGFAVGEFDADAGADDGVAVLIFEANADEGFGAFCPEL